MIGSIRVIIDIEEGRKQRSFKKRLGDTHGPQWDHGATYQICSASGPGILKNAGFQKQIIAARAPGASQIGQELLHTTPSGIRNSHDF
jgi:hypothetical protein